MFKQWKESGFLKSPRKKPKVLSKLEENAIIYNNTPSSIIPITFEDYYKLSRSIMGIQGGVFVKCNLPVLEFKNPDKRYMRPQGSSLVLRNHTIDLFSLLKGSKYIFRTLKRHYKNNFKNKWIVSKIKLTQIAQIKEIPITTNDIKIVSEWSEFKVEENQILIGETLYNKIRDNQDSNELIYFTNPNLVLSEGYLYYQYKPLEWYRTNIHLLF